MLTEVAGSDEEQKAGEVALVRVAGAAVVPVAKGTAITQVF